jgi:hypothetical protein
MNKYINNIVTNKYFPYITLLVLIVLGLFLRIKLLNSDFWYDEGFTGIVVKQDWGRMFELIRLDKVHPPTFYIIVKLWTLLFGSSANALHAITILFGTLLIPTSYYFFQVFSTDNLKGRINGLVVATLLTISPFFAAYSVEARSYTFLALLGMLSLIFFYKAVLSEKAKARKYWTLFITTVSLLVLTHYFSIIIITGYILALILRHFEEKQFFKKELFWTYFWIVTLFTIFAVIAITHYTGLFDLIHKANTSWIPATDLSTLFRSYTSFLFGVGRQIPGIPPYNEFAFPLKSISVTVVLVVSSIVVATNLWNKYSRENNSKELFKLYTLSAITFTPLIAFSLTSSLGLNTLVERYAIIYGVYFFIWITYIWSQAIGKRALILLGVYALMICLLIYPKPVTHYSEITTAIDTIKLNNKFDSIILKDPTEFVLMEYYLEDTQLYVYLPESEKDYSSWAVISRSAEVKSYEACETTCLYIRPKYFNDEKVVNDPRATLLIETPEDLIYKIVME